MSPKKAVRWMMRDEARDKLRISEAAVKYFAVEAGAAICHIHVREPDTGRPSMNIEYYREVVERIRRSGTDLLINLTTGPGGRFIPSEKAPATAAPGTAPRPAYTRWDTPPAAAPTPPRASEGVSVAPGRKPLS